MKHFHALSRRHCTLNHRLSSTQFNRSESRSVIARRTVRGVAETLDRLFIKLRLPNYTIAAGDLETPSSRSHLERFLYESAQARGTPAEPADAALVLRGETDASAIADAADDLADAPLATAAPWYALALLLPSAAPESAAYRTALVDALDALRDDDPTEFLDALRRPVDPMLDGALLSLRRACS